ncbi:hypothetical protein LTR37_007070 [Vermiconidia calcicola]|uniref:Uncharacterized protein n=1 Tax=Vermiconidia calcicola TaxID=1690605 RepID=A0ACC3NGB3_9PEZI|nr:hypothetical protein LTR37_007070 [Vermiconidia calcicola]
MAAWSVPPRSLTAQFSHIMSSLETQRGQGSSNAPAASGVEYGYQDDEMVVRQSELSGNSAARAMLDSRPVIREAQKPEQHRADAVVRIDALGWSRVLGDVAMLVAAVLSFPVIVQGIFY